MDSIENAKHDITDAACSLDTAIELLSSIEKETTPAGDALKKLVDQLTAAKGELEDAARRLSGFHQPTPSTVEELRF